MTKLSWKWDRIDYFLKRTNPERWREEWESWFGATRRKVSREHFPAYRQVRAVIVSICLSDILLDIMHPED